MLALFEKLLDAGNKWIMFSLLFVVLLIAVPYYSFGILLIISIPFYAIYHIIANPSWGSLYALVILIVAALIIWFKPDDKGDDDDPPVKRGRKIISSDDAQRTSRSRLIKNRHSQE
jgi:hypothetical protein